MLSLYRSSSLEQLSDKLLDKLYRQKLANPLHPELIILQNNGMKRWLKHFIAREQGMAANIDAAFPAEFIWKIYRQMDEALPEVLPSEKEPMQFAIFDILQSGDHKKKLQALYRYIQADTDKGAVKRAWHLSVRVADVFDRYQIYRREMILKWQQNELQTNMQSEQWQAELWRLLHKRWDSQHRVELHRAFLKAIKNDSLKPDQLHGQINIFAVSEWPPVFLEAFVELSKIADVHFYWLDPIQKEKNRHPFVQSWGKNGREFLNLFHQYISGDESICQSFNEERLAENKEVKATLLKTLQGQILTGKQGSKKSLSNDRSIQVHSCHSPLREVEVLYDQLLALFEADAEVNPDDIAIVCMEMEVYAPLIEAVFRFPEEGLPAIPFTVADAGQRSAAARAFVKILELLQSRFNVSDIIALLQMPVIQQKMNISYEDVLKLESWIGENNIRWGIDGAFKKQFGLPEEKRSTWQTGLSRMMLGYAMQHEDTKICNGLVPYDQISGSNSAELLGVFYELMYKLFELHYKIQQERTAEDWTLILHNIIKEFLPQNTSNADSIIELNSAAQQLEENALTGGLKQKISFKIVHSYLEKALEKHKTGGRFGTGVTFSSMVGLQNIPFKVIGILGMNEDTFPRLNTTVDFDMMQQQILTGDPDQTETDRYLFLNTLMSAQQTFYISYSGQSNRQQAVEPPSVLVSELLNVIDEAFGIDRQELITHHRLQPFSPYYFKSDTDLFSYSSNYFNTAKKLVNGDAKDTTVRKFLFNELPPVEADIVTLNDLIAFYQHPAKFVLQNRLGIYLKDEDTVDEDRELFALDNLEKYKVKQKILEHCFANKDLDSLKSYFRGRDMLPLQGDYAFQQAADETKSFYGEITDKIGEEDEIEFSIPLQSSAELTGTLSEVCGSSLILFRFGKLKAKYIVEWWLKHLVWNAINESSDPSVSYYYSFEDGKVEESALEAVEDAEEVINVLTQQFKKGLQQTLPFFPETSFAFAEALKKGKNYKKALEEAEKKWNGNKKTFNDESENPYNKLLYKNFNLRQEKQFFEAAKLFFNPYFERMEQGA